MPNLKARPCDEATIRATAAGDCVANAKPWVLAVTILASTISYSANFLLTCLFYRRVTGRRVLPLLLPTRSEFDDLRALPRAIAAWAGGLRR